MPWTDSLALSSMQSAMAATPAQANQQIGNALSQKNNAAIAYSLQTIAQLAANSQQQARLVGVNQPSSAAPATPTAPVTPEAKNTDPFSDIKTMFSGLVQDATTGWSSPMNKLLGISAGSSSTDLGTSISNLFQ